MTDQPWLDGEVDVLDPLIDLWESEGHKAQDDYGWEMAMAARFMQAIRFYAPKLGSNGYLMLKNTREDYEHGRLTRETLKPALMNFDRFAKRVAERKDK